MSEHIQAIYENGILRPLTPLDLPENSVVEIDVRDVSKNDSDKEKWLKEFNEWMNSLDPNTPMKKPFFRWNCSPNSGIRNIGRFQNRGAAIRARLSRCFNLPLKSDGQSTQQM
jgi:predicted DNA-binding antitoxin AbrB/MazE fold protein